MYREDEDKGKVITVKGIGRKESKKRKRKGKREERRPAENRLNISNPNTNKM